MTPSANESDSSLTPLIQQAVDGDEAAMMELFSKYREQLTRMVRLRMDRRLSSRLDASDIVQEANLEAAKRLSEYASNPAMDFYLWLRWIANDKLIDAHRHHIGTQKRQVGQEVSIFARPMAEATSFALAEHLMGKLASPSEAVRNAEVKVQIEVALNDLDPVDREVLVLRHFEHLTNKEAAEILGLKKSGASRRYVEALKRLKQQLASTTLFANYFDGT